MIKYNWTPSGWKNTSTGALGGTPDPSPAIALLFPAGQTADAVLSPGNQAGGGPVIPYGAIDIGAGATVDLGTCSSNDTSS